MNSYERVMAAFDLKEADRVLVTEFSVNMNLVKAFGCKTVYEFQQLMDYDMYTVRIKYKPVEDDGVNFTDEWGIGFQRNGQATSYATKHPIHGPEDIDKLILPDPDDPYRFFNLEQCVKENKGKKAICFSTRLMWLWACDLVGMSEMMELMYDEPEFVDELFDKIAEHQTAVCKNAIRIGADIIDETDDYGFNNGPLVSPTMFRQFCAPRIKKFADDIHAVGGRVIKHSDGDIKLLFDDIVATGVDAHHSMDPEAGVDIAYMKKTYGKKLCLIGNIDCGNLLAFGTPEEVRENVRRCIEIAGPGGGYIVASSNSLPATAKPENVKMIVDATKEFGKYPISL